MSLNLAKKTEKAEYERRVSLIQTYLHSIRKNSYDLGKELDYIKTNNIFTIEYKSWKEFCENKIGINIRTADGYVTLSRNFNREQFIKFGSDKLKSALSIKPENRNEFLNNVQKLSIRETRDLKRSMVGDEAIAPTKVYNRQMSGLKQGAKAAQAARMKKRILSEGKILVDNNRFFFYPPSSVIQYDITEHLKPYLMHKYR